MLLAIMDERTRGYSTVVSEGYVEGRAKLCASNAAQRCTELLVSQGRAVKASYCSNAAVPKHSYSVLSSTNLHGGP